MNLISKKLGKIQPKILFSLTTASLLIFIVLITVILSTQKTQNRSNASKYKISRKYDETNLSRTAQPFVVNDSVQVANDAPVWSGPPSREQTSMIMGKGTEGIIINGPIQMFGSWWWQVHFDKGDGWINQNSIRNKSRKSNPVPPTSPFRLAAPVITALDPANNSTVNRNALTLTGLVSDSVTNPAEITFTVNGNRVYLNSDGTFATPLTVQKGRTSVQLSAAGPAKNPRQQINDISSYLDGSVVYGTDSKRAAFLRMYSRGMLKSSPGNLLPYNTEKLPNANDAHIFTDEQLFIAGDVRTNENIEITSVQTLMMREHNLIASLIAQKYPKLSDEQIFQWARKIVIAEMQVITYKEFLPSFLGPSAIPVYSGYKPNINTGISNEFATAAYRFGHAMVGDDVEFLDNDGNEVRPQLSMQMAFFNPQPIEQYGADPILKYLSTDNAEEVNNGMVNGLRNFLFGPPGAGGFDLESLDIQRGRDMGLADYNTTRRAIGLPAVTDFSQISSNPDTQQKLKSLYGSVDKIDLFIGGLAEDHYAGGSVGITFNKIIADQFTRIRDGDRFWYQNQYPLMIARILDTTQLSEVVSRNTSISKIQDNAFYYDEAGTGNQSIHRPVNPQTSIAKLQLLILLTKNMVNAPAEALNGAGNNQQFPAWGMAGTDFLRIAPAAYADGISTPAGPDWPNARQISNTLCSRADEEINNRHMSAWVYAWGQFIDHDLDLTDAGSEPADIPVPGGDPQFDPNETNNMVINMTRANFDPATGTGNQLSNSLQYTLNVHGNGNNGSEKSKNMHH